LIIYYDEEIDDYVYSLGIPKWRVLAVHPQPDYTLLLTFANGEKRLYDASPLLDEKIYSPLKNLAFFLSAKVDGDSVAWSDELDIAPEHLYECSKPVELSALSESEKQAIMETEQIIQYPEAFRSFSSFAEILAEAKDELERDVK
jgi:hypothetical protein